MTTLAFPKIRKRYKRKCHFCKAKLPSGTKAKYIYPVPNKYGLDAHEGAYACETCTPKVEQEQRAEGHMELVSRKLTC